MRNLYFPFFDHHVAISAYVAEELKKASLRHPVERGVWIRPLGVDCETFCPQRKSAAVRKGMAAVSGAGRDSFLLLYAGRLAPEKNLALVMDMIEVLHEQRFDFRLLVAGDGTRRQWLQECALPRAPGRTVFLGHVQDRGELADLIANCDAFVHPNANEPFGIAPLEAMASGIPVILPDRGGVSSYATNENSVPVRPEGSAFANAARQLAAYPGMVAAIAHNARVTAERFSWIQVTDSFLKLYATIHDVTGGRIPLHCADPEFRSTGVTETGKRATRALANLAGTCFRLYIRMSGAGRTRDDSRPPFHPPTAKVGALCSGHEKTRIQ
jgi:alpha-1,6-mannosyltransferase